MKLDIIQNLDLFSVGLTVAAIGILGFVVFFNNRKSLTNRTFLIFALLTIFWGVVNYLSYQFSDIQIVLFILRLAIFFAVWHAFIFFQLFYVFPEENLLFPKWYKFFLLPLVLLSSIINLTSLSFSKIIKFGGVGKVSVIEQGPGMLLFGGLVIFLIIGGFFLLIKKMKKTSGLKKKQFKLVFLGALLTFSLIFIFNFILPAGFDLVRFIPLGAIFIFPFILFIFYAIFKFHLLNIKIIATEILTFIVIIATFFEILISKSVSEIIFRGVLFLILLIFGIFLIRSVHREVEQREKLQKLSEELKIANNKLEELSRFKTQLLSLASHQIKSPLAVIKSFSQLLLEGMYGKINEKAKITIEKIKSAGENLINLIDTLLDLRKVEEGKMEYHFEKVSLNNLVKNIAEEIRPLAQAKNLEFSFQSDSNENVQADPQKFRQVIQNLIDNAIKYTPAGFVKVEIHSEGDTIILAVIDSGLGISKELLPQMFNEFIRDERVKKEIRGTGLGLYIAKKIVEDHGGEIWAESEGEGKGSKFFVKLKKAL